MQGGSSVVEPGIPAPAVAPSSPVPTTAPVAPTPVIAITDDSGLTTIVVEVVVQHTGYPSDFIELDQDLEGELGIDTVKQAEIMADIRERFTLPLDEEFVLSDYPTLNHMIGYIQRMTDGTPAPVADAGPEQAVPTTPQPTPQPTAQPAVVAAPSASLATDSNIQEQLI